MNSEPGTRNHIELPCIPFRNCLCKTGGVPPKRSQSRVAAGLLSAAEEVCPRSHEIKSALVSVAHLAFQGQKVSEIITACKVRTPKPRRLPSIKKASSHGADLSFSLAGRRGLEPQTTD